MQVNAFHQRCIQPRECGFFRDNFRPFHRQRSASFARNDAAIGNGDGLTRQDATYALEDRLWPAGELHLQQFMQSGAMELGRDQPGSDKRLRFGGKGDAIGDFSNIERLDAEGVARQQHLPRSTIMDRNAIHAAQKGGEARPVPAIQMQGRFAIRSRGGGQRVIAAQFAIIINLAIGDQGGSAGEKRLISGGKVNDRKPGMGQRHIAGHMVPSAIRPAMRKRACERFQHRGGG